MSYAWFRVRLSIENKVSIKIQKESRQYKFSLVLLELSLNASDQSNVLSLLWVTLTKHTHIMGAKESHVEERKQSSLSWYNT